MPQYKVNDAGVRKARRLIDAGQVDTETPWSDAAPSADDQNADRKREGQEGYGEWHLAVDTEVGEDAKGHYRFPYGDFKKVNRAALIHAKQRASQNDHTNVADAADKLLQHLDARSG